MRQRELTHPCSFFLVWLGHSSAAYPTLYFTAPPQPPEGWVPVPPMSHLVRRTLSAPEAAAKTAGVPRDGPATLTTPVPVNAPPPVPTQRPPALPHRAVAVTSRAVLPRAVSVKPPVAGPSTSIATVLPSPATIATPHPGSITFPTPSDILNAIEHGEDGDEDGPPYVCKIPYCGSKFNRRYELDRHMPLHAEGKSYITCGVCGSKFRGGRKDALRRHQLDSRKCRMSQAKLVGSDPAELKAALVVTEKEQLVRELKVKDRMTKAARPRVKASRSMSAESEE